MNVWQLQRLYSTNQAAKVNPKYCLGTTEIQKMHGNWDWSILSPWEPVVMWKKTDIEVIIYILQGQIYLRDGTNELLNITISRVNYKTEVAIFLKSIYITVKQKIWRHSGINIASARRYQVTGAGGAETRLLNCEPWKEITLNYCLETAIVVSFRTLAANLRHL